MKNAQGVRVAGTAAGRANWSNPMVNAAATLEVSQPSIRRPSSSAPRCLPKGKRNMLTQRLLRSTVVKLPPQTPNSHIPEPTFSHQYSLIPFTSSFSWQGTGEEERWTREERDLSPKSCGSQVWEAEGGAQDPSQGPDMGGRDPQWRA